MKDYSNYISIINVKNKLKLVEVNTALDTIYVRCPFCFSKGGTMKLNILNNSYVCKNCEEKGYSIGLYAKVNLLSNKEAFKKLISQEPLIDYSYSPILQNNRKNAVELDLIYTEFLNLLKLEQKHLIKLKELGFNIEQIKKIGFKSIPEDEKIKQDICQKLQNDGFNLQGVPGFYQNFNFKWTFKSHSGIFIPVLNNNQIIGLRINLDKMYSTNTTNIWFSSSKLFNGTKAHNDIMIINPQNKNIQILNSNHKHDVIIATEMILAHKLNSILQNKIIIGVPNVISKSDAQKIANSFNINKIYMIMDYHTMINSPLSAIRNIYDYFDNDNIVNYFSLHECEIPNEIVNEFSKKEIKTNVA